MNKKRGEKCVTRYPYLKVAVSKSIAPWSTAKVTSKKPSENDVLLVVLHAEMRSKERGRPNGR